jgi:hypothetical protein
LKLAGNNVLRAEMQDAYGTVGFEEVTFVLNRPPPPPPAPPIVSVAPHHNEYRNVTQGALVLGYAGPSYVSDNTTQAVGFTYNSEEAKPTVFVQLDAQPDPANAGEMVALSLRLETSVAGAGSREYFSRYDQGSGFQRLSAWMSVPHVPSGPLAYTAVVRAYRSDRTYTEKRVSVRALIVNEQNSRYGAGWSLAGVPRLYPHDLGAMLKEGDGSVRWFPKTSSGGYTTPAGDFTRLVYNATSNTWTRTYPAYDPNVTMTFNGDGYLLKVEDRFGNASTFQWQPSYRPATKSRSVTTVRAI